MALHSIYYFCCINFFDWNLNVDKQVSTQSMPRRSCEGYDQSSKKRKRAGNVSEHPKSNTVNCLRTKRSQTMTSSNSVPMRVSCPVGMYI